MTVPGVSGLFPLSVSLRIVGVGVVVGVTVGLGVGVVVGVGVGVGMLVPSVHIFVVLNQYDFPGSSSLAGLYPWFSGLLL